MLSQHTIQLLTSLVGVAAASRFQRLAMGLPEQIGWYGQVSVSLVQKGGRRLKMGVRDLVPWGRRDDDPLATAFRDGDRHPMMSIQREMNRLFDDVFSGFGRGLSPVASHPMLDGGWPRIEISDSDKEIRVAVEMPGMEEKDVEVLLNDGTLTLKGEKRSETEDKDKKFSEIFYGRFERRIPIGVDIEEDKVEALFRNGVLSIQLPKSEKAQSHMKRIAIKT